MKYIRENGFPGWKLVGTNIAGTILHHIHPSLFLENQEEIRKQVELGNLDPWNLAAMEDRLGCEIFGESYYYTTGPGDCQPPTDEIIRNRVSIGMSPYFQGVRLMSRYRGRNRIDFE